MAVPLVSLLVTVTPRGAPLGAAMMRKIYPGEANVSHLIFLRTVHLAPVSKLMH